MKPNDKIIEEKISKTWEAKYEKWIGRTALSYHLDKAYRDKRMSAQDLEDSYNEIKQFIRQLLEQKEREIVEKIKSAKRINRGVGFDLYDIQVNEALDDIIKLIKTT